MRRDSVPEEHELPEPELSEDAVDNRCGRLGGARPGQLALRGKRDAADPGAAKARRLGNEEKRCVGMELELVR